MKIFAETERLILREIMLTDAEAMFEMDSDDDVHEHIGNTPVRTIEECETAILSIRKQYMANGIGRWAVIEKESGNFVGWSGLKLITEKINGRMYYHDIGFRFQKKHWGKGYATESGIAARDYAFNVLNADIFAMTEVKNLASRKALEKIGLQYVETFPYNGPKDWHQEGAPCTWYHMVKPAK